MSSKNAANCNCIKSVCKYGNMEKSNRAFDSKHKIPQISKRVIEKAEVWLKTH